MKVVICSLNSKYIHSSLAPWCLLAGVREYTDALAKDNLNVEVIEGTINENVLSVLERIKAAAPSAVAFSCYIWNINRVYELINLIKEDSNESKTFSNIKIILGGPEVSYNTEEVFKENKYVDYIISGEGEEPFAKLCGYLCIKNKTTGCLDNGYEGNFKMYGIATRNNPIVEPFLPTYIPPTPYVPEYFDALKGRIAYLETSRGCPFRCAFCLSGRCGGARQYPLLRAEEEIIKLANSGAKTIKLVDRTFNYDIRRAKHIWNFIISHYEKEIPKGVCFHFEIAGDLLDDESFAILKTAPVGLMQMEIGLQSFNEKTLSAINRKTNTEKLCKNIERLIAPNNMHVHIDLIAGLPYEDYQSFRESFNKAYELKPHMLQLGFLKLLHGADMRELEDQYSCEYSKYAPYEVVTTPWLDSNDMANLHMIEDVVDRVSNSGRFKRSIDYICNYFSASGKDYFSVFDTFAKVLKDKNMYCITLDVYTELFYKCYRTQLPKELVKEFRDLLVEDRLTTNASGKLPECLKIQDDNLRKVKIHLESNPNTKSEKGVKRAVAILYTKSKVICVDYKDKNPAFGTYVAKYFELNELLEENNANFNRC